MSWAHFTLGIYIAWTEVATGGVLWKNVYLNFRSNPLGNTFIRVSFVNKLPIIKNIFEWLLLHELHTFPFYPFEGWPIFYMEVGRGVVISRVCGVGFGTETYRWSITWQKICDIIVFVMLQCVVYWHRLTNIKSNVINWIQSSKAFIKSFDFFDVLMWR